MIEIKDENGINELINESKKQNVLLLKHSTQCPISSSGYDEVLKFSKLHPDIKVYIILVIENRSESNLIESLTSVRHESPQVLILKDGICVWNASHRAITVETLETQLIN